jgi:CheY-like chemotaxis protein
MNGRDATLYLQENQSHPHLVFLDLKLPLRGGFEVLEWLKTQPFAERMKVVIVSGSEDCKDLATAQKLGVEYLVKPVSNASLTQKVRAWLDEQHT